MHRRLHSVDYERLIQEEDVNQEEHFHLFLSVVQYFHRKNYSVTEISRQLIDSRIRLIDISIG